MTEEPNINDGSSNHERKDDGSGLEALSLDEELYPENGTARKLCWPPPEAEDDLADDMQPRYEFSGKVIDPQTKDTLFEGQFKTAVNYRGQVILTVNCAKYKSDNAFFRDLLLKGHLSEGSLVCSDSLRISDAHAELHRDKAPIGIARFRAGSLVLKAKGHQNIERLRKDVQSVCIPLYNCLLPRYCFEKSAVLPGIPDHDGYAIKFTWGDWRGSIGQFKGNANRLKAIEGGATGVPMCFLLVHDEKRAEDVTALGPSHPEIRRILTTFSLGTLANPYIRFWQHLDKCGRPLGRIHSFTRVPNWEFHGCLIPDRRSLGTLLEAASRCDDTKMFWWLCAVRHLIASCFLQDPSVGGYHGPFTYVSIAANTLTDSKGTSGKRRGCGGDVLSLERLLGIPTESDPGGTKKEYWGKLWSELRESVIHAGEPIAPRTLGAQPLEVLELFQLHVARILLKIIDYQSYFQSPRSGCLLDTGKPMPLTVEDLKEISKSTIEEYEKIVLNPGRTAPKADGEAEAPK